MVGRRVDRVHRWRGAGQRACKPGWSKEGKSTEKRSLAAVMYAQDVSPDEGRPSGTLAHQEHACAHGRPNSLRTSRLCVCQCWPQNATFCSWRHPRAASVSLLLHASRRPASPCLPRCSLPRARALMRRLFCACEVLAIAPLCPDAASRALGDAHAALVQACVCTSRQRHTLTGHAGRT
jgi:hypothetical protein